MTIEELSFFMSLIYCKPIMNNDIKIGLLYYYETNSLINEETSHIGKLRTCG